MNAGKFYIYAVIVTYNAAKWLDKCLRSLQNSRIPVSIIVVDNGSKDGTIRKIQENYPDVILQLQCENLGFGQANNVGIKIAIEKNADFVFLLNQDAWIEPDAINQLVRSTFDNKYYGVLSPLHLNGNGTKIDLGFSHYLSPFICPDFLSDLYFQKLRNCYETSFVNAAAWLITKECLLHVGGFNPVFFMYGEDDNYIQRLHFHGFKAGVVPEALIYHDRENNDENKTSRSRLLIDYSNPNLQKEIETDLKNLKGQILKNKILLRRTKAKHFEQKEKELRSLPENVSENKELSRQQGATFLI